MRNQPNNVNGKVRTTTVRDVVDIDADAVDLCLDGGDQIGFLNFILFTK